jgi:hypothetical protein
MTQKFTPHTIYEAKITGRGQGAVTPIRFMEQNYPLYDLWSNFLYAERLCAFV